jgi:hypothetical protein
MLHIEIPDLKFEILTLNIHTSQLKNLVSKFQIPNISHRNFSFQLSVFTHRNSNISIFKILDSKHSIYCSTLASLAHASQAIN